MDTKSSHARRRAIEGASLGRKRRETNAKRDWRVCTVAITHAHLWIRKSQAPIVLPKQGMTR